MVPEQSRPPRKDLKAEATVLKWSLCCRVFALLLQVILNAAVVDYDSSACCLDQPGGSRHLELPLGGMRRWDSVYFLRIAEHGYEYEQNSAFFPVWPLTVGAVADIFLSPLAPVLSRSDHLLVSAALTGTVFFCAAAVFLFRLSLRVTRDRQLSLCASLLFCVNPAVVFFHAAYSTSMFACLSFWAMLHWHCGHRWRSTAVMALLCGVRSNGILTCGFVAYELGYRCLTVCSSGPADVRRILRLAMDAFAAALRVSIICSALFVYQAVIYDVYCDHDAFTRSRPPTANAAPVDSSVHPYPARPGWCRSATGLSYGHVQSQYWNVGFLRYFDAKQIPNFALASPVFLLTVVFAVTFTRRTWRRVLQLKLDDGYGVWSPRVFVFAVHWIAFVALCFLNIHIQVLTRLVASATPVFYWFSADLFLRDQTPTEEVSDSQASEKEYRRKPLRQAVPRTSTGTSYFILLYFLVYAYLGLALHSNFYPWT